MMNDQELFSSENDTVRVFIGLGELGVRCLRSLKTKFQYGVPHASAQCYFLGVHSGERENEEVSLSVFSEEETLCIGMDVVTELEETTEPQEAFAWLRTDPASSPGSRQTGRFLMMRKSSDFQERVREIMEEAPEGTHYWFYVFAGLGDTIGSGCFLDVCFLLRSMTEESRDTIFGCFFPPLDCEDETEVRNSRAAVRELDYCMNLSWNGGAFVQQYPSGEIGWDNSPVDFCFIFTPPADDKRPPLQSVTDTASMLTLNLLTPENLIVERLSGLRKRTKNQRACYFACASSRRSLYWNDSYRWVTAWLSQRLEHLRPSNIQQQEQPIKNLVITALDSSVRSPADLVAKLIAEIHDNAEADFSSCAQTWNDWHTVRSSDPKRLTDSFHQKFDEIKKRYLSKADEIEKRAMERILDRLDHMSLEFRQGPTLAVWLLDEKNRDGIFGQIKQLIDYLNSEINERRKTETPDMRQNNAWASFCRAVDKRQIPGFNARDKALKALLKELESVQQEKLELLAYNSLSNAFRQLMEALSRKWTEDYKPLKQAVEQMLDSYRDQFDGKSLSEIENEIPDRPLMEILKKKMGEPHAVKLNSIDSLLNNFMRKMQEDFEKWRQDGHPNEIEGLVRAFQDDVPNANELLWKSLDDYFRERCEFERKNSSVSEQNVADYVYNEYIFPALEELPFCFPLVDERRADDFIVHVLLPSADSMALNLAMERYEPSHPDVVASTSDAPLFTSQRGKSDEMITFLAVCALPVYDCSPCADCESKVFSETPGLYLYEGGEDSVPNWKNLPSILPFDRAKQVFPETERQRYEDTKKLYETARRIDILRADGTVYAPQTLSEEDLRNLPSALRDILLCSLESLSMGTQKDEIHFPLLSDADTQESGDETELKDLFFSAPVLQARIRQIVENCSYQRKLLEKALELPSAEAAGTIQESSERTPEIPQNPPEKALKTPSKRPKKIRNVRLKFTKRSGNSHGCKLCIRRFYI